MENKKGFTVSEVMVTLVLVGVLAGILVPQIMNMRPSTEKVMFRKAYSTIETAVSELINNLAAYPVVMDDSVDTPSERVEQGFHNQDMTSATTNIPAGTVNKFCYLLSQQLNIVGSAACTDPNTNTFTTSDGIAWTVYTPTPPFPMSSTDYSTLITVDVNGQNADGTAKLPNCSTKALINPAVSKCASANVIPDTYQIGVRYDGKLNIDPNDFNAAAILSYPTENSK